MFIIAAIFCGIGLNVDAVFLFVGAPLMIASVLLFTATNGLEFDFLNNKHRSYGKFGFISIGIWRSTPKIVKIRIQIHAENETRQGFIGPRGVAGMTTKTLTYDVVAVKPDGNDITLYSFLKYGNAIKATKTICAKLEVEYRDIVAEKLAENKARRRRR